ncbi:hypothetical protein [Okeania sp. KiyG1]|uniref:hypothetical protein n=1 Tax=Okeania sp. KiyG1 TaxID=2720165 RepID=UPI001920F17A|nr:hypothetical protein [Okeania sp. KiyG1]GGA06788.1 hypothetical protein CYANOKiyG1_19180 [Okeania sp. KiyG1]
MALPKLLNSCDLQPFLANPSLLTEQTRELQLAIANYPDTPTNLLEILVNSSDSLVAEAASHHVNWAGEITENWHYLADTTLQTKELGQNDRLAVELLKIAPVPDYFLSEFVPASYLTLALKNPHLPLRYRLKYLERLSREPNLELRLQVAECGETPVPVLEILAGDLELPIRAAVKSNPTTPPELIELMEGQLATARNWNTDAEQLATLGESRWDLIRLAVAQNPATSGETLMQLARDGVFKIKLAVAKNPQTPANVLGVLAENSGKEIKSAVARHPNATEEILHQLFPTEKRFLGYGMRNLPASILERFVGETGKGLPIWKQHELRSLLLRQVNTPTWILAELANVDLESVRAEKEAQGLKTRNSAKVIESWILDEIRFLVDVAKHPKVSVEILEQLSDSPHPKVQLAVAQNSRTPEQLKNQILLRLAFGDDEEIVRAIARSPETPVAILERLISTSTTGNQAAQLFRKMTPNTSENLPHKITNFVNKYQSSQRILSLLRDENSRESVLEEWRQLLASLNGADRTALEVVCKGMLPAIGLGGGLPRQDRWLQEYHSLTGAEFYLYGLLILLGFATENTANRAIPLALLKNPNTPAPLREELKERLIDSTTKNPTDVIEALAYNSAIPEAERLEYFQQLLSMSRNKEAIARSPNTPPEILSQLMTGSGAGRPKVSRNSNETARRWVAENPGTPVEILLQLATQTLEKPKSDTSKTKSSLANNSVIWEKVLNNPSLPPLERYRLLLEKEWQEETAKADRFISTRLRRRTSLADMIKSSASGTDSGINHHNLYNAAGNSRTPIHILEQLAKHPDESVRSALLNNRALPSNIMLELACDSSVSVRIKLVRKDRYRQTPVEILEMLADDESEKVRELVAENPDTPVEGLMKLANDSSENVKKKLVSNSNTPVEILESFGLEEGIFDVRNANTPSSVLEKAVRKYCNLRNTSSSLSNLLKNPVKGSQMPPSILNELELSHHKSYEIRRLVASHPNTPSHILERLCKDNNSNIRIKVAENPNTSSQTLEKLYKDSEYLVRAGVAKNPNTPPHLLEKIARQEDPNEKYRSYSIDKLKTYHKDRAYYTVISPIAKRLDTPAAVLEFLANSPETNIRKIVARNPNTPSTALESLATTESDIEVLKALTHNPNLTTEALQQLSSNSNRDFLIYLIRTGELSPEVWQQLAENENAIVREAIASSSITSVHILEALTLDKDTEVRRKVAANPNTPTTSLDILSQDSMAEVRTAVAGNQNTNVIVLEQLGQDEKVEVRRAVAKNPNTPALLQESLKDLLGLPYVRKASTTLSGLSRIYKPDTDDLPTLLSEYAKSDNAFVRFVTLMHPLTPVDSITEGCQSLFWQERYAIAENPSTLGEIRQQLTNDSNRIVRATAKANL